MKIGKKLTIQNVTKYYGTYKALTDINLSCEPGEFITILGSSGCGKTTLLKVIAGFENKSEGCIFIDDDNIENLKPYERNIGMLFQNYALFPHMTIAENIAYPLKLRKVPKDEVEKRVREMIEMVKLTGMEKRFPKQLSGGQQQRVALARAIVYNPPLLLLDEPLGALDMNLRHEMQFEIKRITKKLGITTISVTHDQEEAFAMSDKICIMNMGKIQQFDTPENIYEHPANRFVAEFMGTTNIIEMKNLTYRMKGNTCLVKGIPGITEEMFELELPAEAVQVGKTEGMITLRPECIHLKENQDNTFTARLKENVYIGECVKIKGLAGKQLLNINLSVSEYRKLNPAAPVTFGFDKNAVSIIYS
ncbi:MAG: ABC transporter ATP-binding protein [Lachnospiraceae bacterium]|nr:ABC transporter ATP-binding protein [Lachnospiraceae bacterium]